MLASAPDREVIKFWKIPQAFALNLNQLVVPDAEDWLQAGLILQRLSQGSKSENFGSTPKFSPEERVRLFNDCLLAVSCRRAGVTVVTDNAKDFERLSSVCRVKCQSSNEFFVDFNQ